MIERRIQKVLVANRGEIACRIMRTLQALGIRSVAIYSDADAASLHVSLADEAVRVGEPPAIQSYLHIENIMEAAIRTGADAIHPGYGFLSENSRFVDACEAAGITFVGPDAKAIEAMGRKDAAKTRMQAAGVPVVPGYHGPCQDPEFLADQADKIGYPVLIKAWAGGGGKGMRRVDCPQDLVECLVSARREAQASFGEDRVLIEKYIQSPRHIEFQVFGDRQGHVVHLFERDCSLQRRYQKVIEESPAPGMTAAMRHAMGAAAVQAARAVDYVGAGTVEFIVDGVDGLRPDRFWFMEMNTRLQVEHPVTEAITGQDLVAWQIAVAEGRPLPQTQDELCMEGHAVEARLYAEDTAHSFLPATGVLQRLELSPMVRVDTGVQQGDQVTSWYDPMIAKLIAHGPDRPAALDRLRAALEHSFVAGCHTNLRFLARLCHLPEFMQGKVETGLLDQAMDALADIPPPPEILAAAAILVSFPAGDRTPIDPWESYPYWRAWSPAEWRVSLNGILVDLTMCSRHDLQVRVGSWQGNGSRDPSDPASIVVNGHRLPLHFHREGDELLIASADREWILTVDGPELGVHEEGEAENRMLAPMPGQITRLEVATGDAVAEGQVLVVMEAMKMEHVLRAPHRSMIAAVHVQLGDQVSSADPLIELAPHHPDDQ